MLKKILLSGLIFLIVLFLQLIFVEKNFAEGDTEKTSVKGYNFEICKKNVLDTMHDLVSKNRESYYSNIEKKGISLREKSEYISYNFRVLSCNFEAICSEMQAFMFYGKNFEGDGNQGIYSNDGYFVTTSCPKVTVDRNIFKNCNTSKSDDFVKLLKYCEDKKEEILYGDGENGDVNGNSGEYGFITHNFKNDAKKDKVNFLSARIYDLNVKMRKLVSNMNELKIKITDIANKLVCTEK